MRAHQLFLAGMTRRVAAPKPVLRRRGEKGRPRKAAPAPAGPPRPAGVQLSLLDTAAARHYRYGRVDLRATAKPDNPWLRWALYLAHRDGEAHGWGPVMRRGVQRSLTMLLAEHRPGEHILASIVEESVRPGSTNAGLIIDLLDRMHILTDDRVPTFDQWLDAKLEGLSGPIRADVHDWVRVLRDGAPRRRPRRPTTAAAYLHAARPALLAWSQRYDHLREVTADDIRDEVVALHGHPRQMCTTALRSLFGWARRERRIFRNPAAHQRNPRAAEALWQPLEPAEIARTLAAATTPQARVFVVLAAVHAARPGQIRALHLDHIELAQRRLTIDGHDRPLDELTHQILRRVARRPPPAVAEHREPPPDHQHGHRDRAQPRQRELPRPGRARAARDDRPPADRPSARGSPHQRRGPTGHRRGVRRQHQRGHPLRHQRPRLAGPASRRVPEFAANPRDNLRRSRRLILGFLVTTLQFS